jgi:lysophospholipase L1-like esterase
METQNTRFKSPLIIFCILLIAWTNNFTQTIRIMPLGDSITWGITYLPAKSTDEGYRGFLKDSLDNAGYNTNFVGTLSNGNTLTDKEHDGHPAWYANKSSSCGGACVGPGIAAAVDSFLTLHPADIVLLHIGTNDILLMDANPNTNTISGLVDDIELIISNIHAHDANIIVIVALIVNSPENTNITSLITQLNAALSTALTETSTLHVVDMESALTYPDDIVTDDLLSDAVHPDTSGYFKMAKVWFDKLKFVIDTYILPVELTSFSGAWFSGGIRLNWSTATEINNHGFEIQRSKSKVESDWQKIGFVNGHGNSNAPIDYSFTDVDFSRSSKYYYRLKQIDNDGAFEYSKIIEVVVIPQKYELAQNFPNPFNPTSTINYNIPVEGFVKISVFNSLGETVKILVNEYQGAGNYQVEFIANDLSSGVYFYGIEAGSYFEMKKMILLK